jgi:hypothetical protein
MKSKGLVKLLPEDVDRDKLDSEFYIPVSFVDIKQNPVSFSNSVIFLNRQFIQRLDKPLYEVYYESL